MAKTKKTTKKRNGLTIPIQKKILTKIKAGKSYGKISRLLDIPKSTIRNVNQRREKIEAVAGMEGSETSTKIRPPKHGEMESAIYEWLLKLRENEEFQSPDIQGDIRTEARRLHQSMCKLENCKFNAALGWLRGFRKRFSLDFSEFGGEGGSSVNDSNEHTESEETEDSTEQMDGVSSEASGSSNVVEIISIVEPAPGQYTLQKVPVFQVLQPVQGFLLEPTADPLVVQFFPQTQDQPGSNEVKLDLEDPEPIDQPLGRNILEELEIALETTPEILDDLLTECAHLQAILDESPEEIDRRPRRSQLFKCVKEMERACDFLTFGASRVQTIEVLPFLRPFLSFQLSSSFFKDTLDTPQKRQAVCDSVEAFCYELLGLEKAQATPIESLSYARPALIKVLEMLHYGILTAVSTYKTFLLNRENKKSITTDVQDVCLYLWVLAKILFNGYENIVGSREQLQSFLQDFQYQGLASSFLNKGKRILESHVTNFSPEIRHILDIEGLYELNPVPKDPRTTVLEIYAYLRSILRDALDNSAFRDSLDSDARKLAACDTIENLICEYFYIQKPSSATAIDYKNVPESLKKAVDILKSGVFFCTFTFIKLKMMQTDSSDIYDAIRELAIKYWKIAVKLGVFQSPLTDDEDSLEQFLEKQNTYEHFSALQEFAKVAKKMWDPDAPSDVPKPAGSKQPSTQTKTSEDNEVTTISDLVSVSYNSSFHAPKEDHEFYDQLLAGNREPLTPLTPPPSVMDMLQSFIY